MEENMKKKNLFCLGMQVMVFVLGLSAMSCASYMEWYYSTLPGGREQHDRQMAEINQRNRDAQNERNQGTQSGGGGTQDSGTQSGGTQGSGTSNIQQPETITRFYIFNVPTSGQAGGGAAAVARSEAEASATEQFRLENPGFEIRNIQSSHDGTGTITVTITGRRTN
jgi:hypothetical protein